MPIKDVIVRIRTFAEIREMEQILKRLYQMEAAGMDVGKSIQKVNRALRGLRIGFKEFRMELLSVMFGARQLAHSLFGLLQPALQSVGVFEIWGDLLEVFFLPIALEVLDFFIFLFDWFMKLPEPVREFIGAIIGLIAGFLTFLAAEAALGLFLDGLITRLGKLNLVLGELNKFAKVFSIVVAISGIQELAEGNILKGISNIMTAAGLFFISSTPGKMLLFGGLVLSIISQIDDTKTTFLTKLANALLGGYLGFQIGGPWGAGLGFLATMLIQVIIEKKKEVEDILNKDKAFIVPQPTITSPHTITPPPPFFPSLVPTPTTQNIQYTPTFNISSTGTINYEEIRYKLGQDIAIDLTKLARH